MQKIVVRKADSKIVSAGDEDISRFNPQEFDIIEIEEVKLPDEIKFCFYKDGQVKVDEKLKQETLEKEAKAKRERKKAREYIALENLAGLTNEQIENWIDQNVTNLSGGKLAIKKLVKWCRALTRVLALRQDD